MRDFFILKIWIWRTIDIIITSIITLCDSQGEVRRCLDLESHLEDNKAGLFNLILYIHEKESCDTRHRGLFP